jgi:hypothetical protein
MCIEFLQHTFKVEYFIFLLPAGDKTTASQGYMKTVCLFLPELFPFLDPPMYIL